MALIPWPDFATATATDWAPLAALLHAMQERVAVAKEYSTNWDYSWISFGYEHVPFLGAQDATYDGRKAPSLDVLKAIRDGIVALAAGFLNLDDRGTSGFGAPQRWTGEELVALHPHLAILPERSAVEACAESLADYRAFLSNAAAALDRLRYVDALRHVAYAKNMSVDAVGTPADCMSALASPSVETFDAARRFPFSRQNPRPSYSFVRSFTRHDDDTWDWNTDSWTHSVSDSEIVEARASADIYVANPTPFEARIFVLAKNTTVDLPYSRNEQSVQSVIQRSNPSVVIFGTRSTSYIERETIARTQKETLSEVTEESQDDDTGERRWATTETTTVWSDDATRSRSSTETDSGVSRTMDTTHPPSEHLWEHAYGFPAYSGFAWPCAMPDPQPLGVLAPRSQRNILPAPAAMPAPDWENLSGLAKAPGGTPRACASVILRTFSADAVFVLDFGFAFTYGGEPVEEEAT